MVNLQLEGLLTSGFAETFVFCGYVFVAMCLYKDDTLSIMEAMPFKKNSVVYLHIHDMIVFESPFDIIYPKLLLI